MDLSLTESQEMLKSTAIDFLKRECPWTLVKEINESETGFSKELWEKIAELGWLGMLFPEEYDGMGCSLTDIAVTYEEIGKAIMPGPYFSSSILCGSIILVNGSDEQKKQLLPAISSGEKILAFALTEPDYGWGPECVHLTATEKNDGFVLNGTKRFIHDAHLADQIICVARTQESSDPAEGISLFLVDKQASGLSCRNLVGFVGEKLNELTFDSVKVPASDMLGEKDKGWQALNDPMNKACVILSSYMVGACQYLLDLTVGYARQRVQFGRPIAAFQWVQGYIIEQANHLEKARWITNDAVWKLDSGKPQEEQDEAASLAMAVASEAFHEVSHLSHEVHAGVGVDKKYSLYLYSTKSKTLFPYLGDPHHHNKRVAQLIGL